MRSRSDIYLPYKAFFNFGVDSVFDSPNVQKSKVIPILPNQFLLLDTEFFMLLDGENFLLLGT